MRHASLFSGIGGPDLAAEWMGWENVFHCEINPFGRKILNYYWPNSISYEDIKTTDFTIHRGGVDILTGGFPCQPFSHAGNRKGAEDDRYLWPEMLRAISEIMPTWIVGENVAGIRSMGIEQSYSALESSEVASIEEVMVIEEIRQGLEEIGYELQPFIIPACAVNAPHRRDRVWFVAYASGDGSNRTSDEASREAERSHGNQIEQPIERGSIWASSDTDSLKRCERGLHSEECSPTERHACSCNACGNWRPDWEKFPNQSPVCDGDDGLSSRLDGITFSKWRTESIKAGGNAIVPQVIYKIFKAIDAFERL